MGKSPAAVSEEDSGVYEFARGMTGQIYSFIEHTELKMT